MKSLKKQRRIQVVIIIALASVVSAVLFGMAFKEGINLFRSPSQVVDAPPLPGEVFRIGGLVEDGTLVVGQGESITFVVTDGGASVPVSYTGIRPDLFGEGQGTVATGRYINGVFEATEILAKHDETYIPSEVVDALKEQGVYQDPNG